MGCLAMLSAALLLGILITTIAANLLQLGLQIFVILRMIVGLLNKHNYSAEVT